MAKKFYQGDWGAVTFRMSSSKPSATRKAKDPIFPGVEAWNEGGYWDDWRLMSSISIGMLTVPPLEALAQLGKISDRALRKWPNIVEQVMAGEMMLDVGGVPMAMFEATGGEES